MCGGRRRLVRGGSEIYGCPWVLKLLLVEQCSYHAVGVAKVLALAHHHHAVQNGRGRKKSSCVERFEAEMCCPPAQVFYIPYFQRNQSTADPPLYPDASRDISPQIRIPRRPSVRPTTERFLHRRKLRRPSPPRRRHPASMMWSPRRPPTLFRSRPMMLRKRCLLRPRRAVAGAQ